MFMLREEGAGLNLTFLIQSGTPPLNPTTQCITEHQKCNTLTIVT